MIIYASAYILVGGKSERFGSPKWKARLDGKTLLERAWDLLDPIFQETKCVSRQERELTGRPTIYDTISEESPFSGLYSALMATSTDWNFVLSCDLPLVNERVIRTLWAQVSDRYEVVSPTTERGVEPTCSFYRRSLLPICRKMIEDGNYALNDLISQSKWKGVDFTNEETLFTNVNTPEDIEKVKTLMTP